MPRKRLVWQFYPSFLLITVISLFAVAWYASHAMRQFYFQRVAEDLEVRAQLLEDDVREDLRSGKLSVVDALCKNTGKATKTRITVVLPSGRVVGDSDQEVVQMDDHSSRPEVREALAGKPGVSTRWSSTLKQNMMYFALPVREGEETTAVIRTSVPLTQIERLLRTFYIEVAVGGLITAVLAAVVSLCIYRKIAKPLDEIRQGAERFARGEFGVKIAVLDTGEVGDLARSMNQMAEQLDDRIRTVVRQRNEQEAMLSSMVEGVLAVDANERLISTNQAAARMLGIALESARGTTIPEVVRNPELQRFVTASLSADVPQEGNIALLGGDGERFLQAHGAALRDARGDRIGAVVVLNDVTRLRRLENVRREFVANVSHELKTPITSIKGFVETLIDGALQNPEEAERFLAVVAKHADRLNSIIEDLLLLSRIEQEAERASLDTEETNLKDVLREAIDACAVKASDKAIAVELDCPDDLVVIANEQLLTQAVVNLIDNAIKYSEQGGPVLVEAVSKEGDVLISVRDRGCGIAKEHLLRLGERFYRVDKARSRQQGGTGLGLAIVKHIVEAHGGAVSAESTVGKGSSFHIRLPRGTRKS